MRNIIQKLFKTPPLRLILSTVFVIQILIIAGLVSLVSYRNQQETVNTLALQLQDETATRIEQHLQSFLEAPKQINQYNTSVIQKGDIDPNNVQALQNHFLEQVKVSQSISSIYFGNEDGGIAGSGREGAGGELYIYSTENFKPGVFKKYFVDENGSIIELAASIPNFDARERPWYRNASKSSEPVWSDVYILFTGQDLAIAASSPVYNEAENLIGVASVDIFLTQISDFLKSQQVSKTGEIFIVERSGMLIATSSDDVLFRDQNADGTLERVKAEQVQSPLIQAAAGYLSQTFGNYENIPDQRDLSFYNSNERQLMGTLSIKDKYGLDWLIVVVVPESEFTAKIEQNNRLTWLIISLSVVISILLSIYLAEKITSPISQFIAVTNALSNQEWGGAIANQTYINELNELAMSFNQMSAKLQGTMRYLSTEILKREEAQRSLLESEIRYTNLMSNIPVGMFRSTPSGKFIAANPAFLKMFGRDIEELPEEINAWELYKNPSDRENFLKALAYNGVVSNMEIPFMRSDKSIFWGAITARGVWDEQDNIQYIDGTIEDITEQKKADEAMIFMATHDTLTETPNRALFEDRLLQAIDRALVNDKILAVVLLDLDGFKAVNDAFGHKHGDWLLKLTAERLKNCVRSTDTVARFGGDEFSIIVEGLTLADDVVPFLEKLSHSVARPFKVLDAEIFITASIGVSIFPNDGTDPDTLIQNADRSMYFAKGAGRNNYQFFSLEMKSEVLHRLELGNQLRQAIDKQELLVYYQPQVDILSGKVIGLEALLRWQHPTLGLLYPGNFMGLAEDLGLIVPLGKWVLETVCKQAKKWKEAGMPVSIALNISEREVRRKDLLDVLQEVLSISRVPPELIEFELTENVVFQDTENMDLLLQQVKKLGVRLAIDDFGTGYSSLGRLAKFPFDKLKIDKQLAPRENSPHSEVIVTEGIISIAQRLGMEVIAEGVETKSQIEFYRSLNCTHIQGWFYSPAVSAQEIERYLREGFPPFSE